MNLLFADDDPITRETLCACTESEGFSVVLAADGQEALDAWKRYSPDLLCLDIMMPRLDGYEVCRRIRTVDTRVPILFLSAKSEEIDVVAGLQLGADDFIRKPFGKRELLARIQTALRRVQPFQDKGRSFSMKCVKIWPRELRAEREGVSVDLSPREVGILEFLHRHAGEAVSRDDLLNNCWGMDYFPESRTLDQHVAVLRKKIEQDPSRPQIIETIRGVGYRFRSPGSADSACRRASLGAFPDFGPPILAGEDRCAIDHSHEYHLNDVKGASFFNAHSKLSRNESLKHRGRFLPTDARPAIVLQPTDTPLHRP